MLLPQKHSFPVFVSQLFWLAWVDFWIWHETSILLTTFNTKEGKTNSNQRNVKLIDQMLHHAHPSQNAAQLSTLLFED